MRRATRAISSIARRRAELDFLRFPLGDLDKTETRALAREFALPVADKPDSQDICFVPHGSYAAMVTRLRPEAGEPGDIVDSAGHVLGRHQRHRPFHRRSAQGAGRQLPSSRFMCCASSPRSRRVVVGPKSALAETRIAPRRSELARDPARRRRRAGRRQAALGAAAGAGDALSRRRHDGEAELVLDAPAGAVAPGQAAVLYDGERVLGGGWIRRRNIVAA